METKKKKNNEKNRKQFTKIKLNLCTGRGVANGVDAQLWADFNEQFQKFMRRSGVEIEMKWNETLKLTFNFEPEVWLDVVCACVGDSSSENLI